MPRPPNERADWQGPVNSQERPSLGHTLNDVDFSDPRILSDIRAVFDVLAEIEIQPATQQLRAA